MKSKYLPIIFKTMQSSLNTNSRNGKLIEKPYLLPFVLVTSLFLLWGIPNNLNDILIRQFMKSFELTRFQAGLVQSAFYAGYFLLAYPSALFMRKYSYKSGLIAGLLLFAIGCFLFYPAALSNNYSYFLSALFVIAAGLTFLETGANSFIATLGDNANSERRLTFAQAFNPIGSIIGVLIGTAFIFSGIELSAEVISLWKQSNKYQQYLQDETMRVVVPFLILSGFSVIMAFVLLLTKFPVAKVTKVESQKQVGNIKTLFNNKNYVQGVIAQFFYVGAQVGTWSYFIQYVQDNTGSDEKTAGLFLTGTLVAFAIGRFSATYVMKFIKPAILMKWFSLVNSILVLFSILFPGIAGMWALFSTSFFMSLMYPTIFAMSVKGLGENTKIGSSFLVMAIIGGAVCPPLMGLIAEIFNNMTIGFIIPLVGYLYLIYYSSKNIIEKK